MSRNLSFELAWPAVSFGILLAVTCLASIWYLNRLQADLAKVVSRDVAGMEVTTDMKLRLRRLQLDSILYAAKPTPSRRNQIIEDERSFENDLHHIQSWQDQPEERDLIARIASSYESYQKSLGKDGIPQVSITSTQELVDWSNAHPIGQIIESFRELVELRSQRMTRTLEKSEGHTRDAGRILIVLAIAGSLGGVLSGFAIARGLSHRVARLSVRVQAVQAHLDQEVAELEVDSPQDLGSLDQQLEAVVSRVKDVCERLQRQERDILRAEQLALVGHLAAGVAHEIRNPLTGVKLLIEAASRSKDPIPLLTDELVTIKHEIRRIETTVQSLLDLARAPRLNLSKRNIVSLLEQAIHLAQPRAELKHIYIEKKFSTDCQEAEIDPDQFISMMVNLLQNAIEATPPNGKVSVTSRVNKKRITIDVSDSGPGIADEVFGELFAPFKSTKPTGTGLGLSIARRIAIDHGGSIVASNLPTHGACFTVILPLNGSDVCRS